MNDFSKLTAPQRVKFFIKHDGWELEKELNSWIAAYNPEVEQIIFKYDPTGERYMALVLHMVFKNEEKNG